MKHRIVQSNELSSESLRAEDHVDVVVLPEQTEGWEILNRRHLEEVVIFATKVGKLDSLIACFDRLQAIATNTKSKVRLTPDFAPHSFFFTLAREESTVLVGGVIFHGKHDNGGDGGAPTYSVNLSPHDGWSIHT